MDCKLVTKQSMENGADVLCSMESNVENILCYPNPTNDAITLQIDQVKSKFEVEVYSTLGQLLVSKQFKNSSEESLLLPKEPAVYVIKVHSDLGTSVIRVVKK